MAQSATGESRVDDEIDDARVFVRVDRVAVVYYVAFERRLSLVISIAPPHARWSGFAGHLRLVFEAA